MPDAGGNNRGSADSAEFAAIMAEVAQSSQRIAADFLKQHPDNGTGKSADPFNLGDAFSQAMARMMANPIELWQAQIQLWNDSINLWHATSRRMFGLDPEAESVIEPEPGDRRFKDDDWSENPIFDYIKQSYLLAARYLQTTVGNGDSLDSNTARKVEFFTKQFVDALSPTNFAATNPQVLRATVESRGANLVEGFKNMLADLDRGKGALNIKMTDTDAFELGRNVATTPGQVVYQNDLIQLLQYQPLTDKVYQRPLLIMPPWINKYYILDLQPKNSFIRWAVEQGHTVFVISWVNPDEQLSKKEFDDYLLEGPLAALDAMEKATGEKQVNVIGYCLGGTLLAAMLAYMAAKGDKRIVSATHLTTLIDFHEPGDLGVFIDEKQVESLEQRMNEKGYLEGKDMANTFNMLRSNDLIWSFVINNYLLGKEPMAFDLLYWNSDSTRMPAAMHSYYLRNMYMKNSLKEPGALEMCGQPIDMTKVKTPAYFLSAVEDHIAPWETTYSGARLYSGLVRFVLSASGHVAGVINPPAANKYSYWVGGKALTEKAGEWFANAREHHGSWWSDWGKWVAKYGGEKVAARTPGDGKLKVLEDAPGSYVKVRAQD
ncbi:MAG: class I poly(R)-hydroxyalkanoic acid synthase [Gammaproteobacteria bacterium]|nr:class I poly(R)-hydroxyalkanoic acid synthase [Gammaproteobacteria bacterium]